MSAMTRAGIRVLAARLAAGWVVLQGAGPRLAPIPGGRGLAGVWIAPRALGAWSARGTAGPPTVAS